MMTATGSDHISISGLVLDGSDIPLPPRRGLLHFTQGRAVRIADCEIVNAGRNGITLEGIEGEVTGNTIGAADAAIFSLDARGLRIADNTVRGAGNGGILVWRNEPGDDGTLVVDNRIEGIANRAGGSGEYGNAINIFRADNVIVRGNRIRNAAFSAVRGNKASNLQIVGNTCTGLGEVALYAEFGFQGAVIANNIVDGAGDRRLGHQFQRGRPARSRAGKSHPQSHRPPPRRHRSERRRRHRHRRRGRHGGDRQCRGKRAERRHRRRLGPLFARCRRHLERHPRRRLRHHRLRRAGRRHRR